ncbi:MAG: L-seryl-tRNA(Sec) selenium transferase [Bacillota bacterium]|nr:L-seryl-tRNA(Sec) selenium transferase [Bacillota bacterium]
MSDFNTLLRKLPAIDSLLRDPLLEEALLYIPRRQVLQAAQDAVDLYRKLINEHRDNPGQLGKIDLSAGSIAETALELARKYAETNLKALINATGVVIHTNLGRVPLARSAVNALIAVAENYNNLELNLETGKRGSRQVHVEELICELCGSEAALTVNNNAAAVFLALNTIASGREVIVSRGQLVEIGGSFRIPEIMKASGARLVEVGTTNKTYLRDYEAAINENTAALLKVHTSNYHMIGFTAEVETSELSALAQKYNIISIEDLGSGVMLDLEQFKLPAEPRIQDSIKDGADIVTFSGDKMLGGPQAGILVGRKDLITYMRSNQLARTLRVDKFTLAALEATLRLYLDEKTAANNIPVWRMLTAEPQLLNERAGKIAAQFSAAIPGFKVSVIEGFSKVGGGALPTADLPTSLVSISFSASDLNSEKVVEKLRSGHPPVIARLQQESLLFDPRTIFEEQEDLLVEAVKDAFAGLD